jgi:hypothetical protein
VVNDFRRCLRHQLVCPSCISKIYREDFIAGSVGRTARNGGYLVTSFSTSPDQPPAGEPGAPRDQDSHGTKLG